MKEEEYKALIDDPSDFWIRKSIPRTFGAHEGLKDIPPFTDLWEIVIVSPHFIPFSNPSVEQGLKKLVEAGRLALEWISKNETVQRRNTENGLSINRWWDDKSTL